MRNISPNHIYIGRTKLTSLDDFSDSTLWALYVINKLNLCHLRESYSLWTVKYTLINRCIYVERLNPTIQLDLMTFCPLRIPFMAFISFQTLPYYAIPDQRK